MPDRSPCPIFTMKLDLTVVPAKPLVDLGIIETAHAARIRTDRKHRQKEIGTLQRRPLISELMGDVFVALRAFRHVGVEAATQIDAKGRLYCNNGDLLPAAAVEGAGIISLPDLIFWDSVKEGRLIPILEDYVFQEVSIYAIYPRTRHLSAKIRAFVDQLVVHFAPGPHWMMR